MRISNSNNTSTQLGKNKSTTKEKFSNEVDAFESKVKNQLKNGKPAYNIGMTAITEQDWEDLMDNIDDYMEKAKELRDEALARDINESMESRIYNKVYLRLHGNDNPRDNINNRL